MQKRWQLAPKVDAEIIKQFPELNEVVLQLLNNRGLNNQALIDEFLLPNYDAHVHDPFLFKDMAKAVERIFLAAKRQEKVMIYGDYDADGVCSTTIMFATLKKLGAEVDYYIPFREGEGYGLNLPAAQKIAERKFTLVITVDCGVSNHKEIAYLKEQGIDTIVLDHHQEPMERPQAFALIDPALVDSGYPYKYLCGAGVGFKVVQALMLKQSQSDIMVTLPSGYEKWLLDLVALATVADICPLIGENRALVKYGLIVLEKTKRLGLQKMIKSINENNNQVMDTKFIGWRLAPRLNAAGRIGHAGNSFNLLICDEQDKADNLIINLEDSNMLRQKMTEKAMKEALEYLSDTVLTSRILVAVNDGWEMGIVGLVAGRLTDRFSRPALIMTKKTEVIGNETVVKFVGSGRSIPAFDITKALKECDELLARYGGHAQACGFTILGEDNLEKFKIKIMALAEEKLQNADLRPTIDIEAEVKLAEINWELWENINKFEPFGEGNDVPLFVARHLIVETIKAVGNDGKHLSVLVSQEGYPNLHKLIGFSFGEWCAKLKRGDKIDVIFELGVNQWNGNRELQLKIIDLKLSE
ncbi:MAG: single-stranded-DNA-specific exonuclease RecJ [bacterium]